MPLDATISAADPEVIKNKLEALSERYRHDAEKSFTEQPLIPQRRRSPKDFTPIHCRGFVTGDIRWLKSGVSEIRIQIPFEYRDLVHQLVEMVDYPLEMYVRPCVSKYD